MKPTTLLAISLLAICLWSWLMQIGPMLRSNNGFLIMKQKSVSSLPKHKASSTKEPQHRRPVQTTKLLAFTDYSYRELSMKWYDRMMALGYNNSDVWVQLVTVDTASRDFFRRRNYESAVAQTGPPLRNGDYLFALRWKYVLRQLQAGWNIILADVDNIFVKAVAASQIFASETIDVFHTYGTKHPPKVFAKQGFVVCGCLTALRATNATIDFVQRLVRACGNKCDDQQVMNELYYQRLHMDWYEYDVMNRTTNSTEFYFDGLPVMGRTGRSNVTNHTVHIWDRAFANRAGFLGTEACPPREINWASMPNHKHLKKQVQLSERLQIKMQQFDEWDKLCHTSPFTTNHTTPL